MDKKEITKLWEKIKTLGVIYETKNGKIIERKLGDYDGDKVSKEVWKEKNLDEGCWRFCVYYSGKLLERYTDFIGIDENGKLIKGSIKGGYYIGGYRPYLTSNSEFYIDKESADKALGNKKIDHRALLIKTIKGIKEYAHNCLHSEDIDYFDEKTEEILELVEKI